MSKRTKTYNKMNADELLAAATAKYDKPFGGWDEFKPLTAHDRQLHRQARGRGSSKVVKDTKRVMITMEMSLLKRADAKAKRLGVSRSKLISDSIQSILKAG